MQQQPGNLFPKGACSYKWYVTLLAACFIACSGYAGTIQPRTLTFTYTCHITNIPSGARQLNCWIPVPSSDERQTVELLPVLDSGKITTEHKYGNRMYYRQIAFDRVNVKDSLTITLSYKIKLNEKSVPEAKALASLPKAGNSDWMKVYLTSNRLIPLDGPIEALNQQLQLENEPIRAARQIYDYLIDNMVYNYKAPGAGIGDVRWACNSKTGDCSDYHSIFIALCRSRGIPADHVFGLPLRAAQGKGKAKDWHCWARFYVEGPGWITIDASEADKHPELRDYLFGTLSDLYLTISHGRDVVLEPAQQGPALNIFADPYVEIDGKPYTGVKWEGAFEALNQN
ncbi:transglutaminase-like domain-containing protein [Agriterribacter humi]|uniref:transglutaminase-like domain-containing protein n=1 Tax=Agriterribacter humi TaxID=1104781 RepID=UPI0012640871|nr:transglutaminase domain-containing protein [Agriterribacter humi]